MIKKGRIPILEERGENWGAGKALEGNFGGNLLGIRCAPSAMWWFSVLLWGNQALQKTIRGVVFQNDIVGCCYGVINH